MNIHMDQNFLNAKARGIEAPYAVGFMPFDEKDGRIVLKNINRDQLAQDAALSTQPNVGAPAALYTYVDPRIIDVLFGVTNATKFFDKTLVGSFTQDYATFSVEEVAGQVSPYNDFANGTSTDVNYNFPVRQNFRYQTTIKYGDLETAKLAEANVNLPARKPRRSLPELKTSSSSTALRAWKSTACSMIRTSRNRFLRCRSIANLRGLKRSRPTRTTRPRSCSMT